MGSEMLKKRTKDFTHQCVKLAISLPRATLENYIRERVIIDVQS
jgi:hypothetical protein